MKLEPENQFSHSIRSVTALAELYGLVATRYREATSGIENTTLLVTCENGEYVFRIYRQRKKTSEQILAEIDFTQYLHTQGIPTVSIKRNKQGEQLSLFESAGRQWQVIVMDLAPGEHAKNPSPALLVDIATTQARMHIAASTYDGQQTAIRKLTELTETEFIQQINLADLTADLRSFLERGAAYRLALDDELPTGPSHLDYNRRNMLCQDDTVTAVLDFDDMSVAPYVVCLAYSLWHIQDDHGINARDNYLAAYQRMRPLQDTELKLLPQAMLFRHYMISAIKVLDGQRSAAQIANYFRVEALLSR